MRIWDILRGCDSGGKLPPYIRAVDARGDIKVVRLQGDVGKSIGEQVHVPDEALREPGEAGQSMIFDFAGTTGADFSTVSYLVEAVRYGKVSGTRVGIINAPQELLAVIDVAKLSEICRVYESEDAAVRDMTA